jgi:hypothetical protein
VAPEEAVGQTTDINSGSNVKAVKGRYRCGNGSVDGHANRCTDGSSEDRGECHSGEEGSLCEGEEHVEQSKECESE